MLLCRLAFFSQRAWRAPNPAEDDFYLQRILDAGLRNNPRHGLTGVLLVDGGIFVQVLEGARGVLYDTLRRIERNPGHSDMILTGYSEADDRLFESWSVLVREAPSGLQGTPWIPNPGMATHGQIISTALRVNQMSEGIRRIRPGDATGQRSRF
tara:strand:- start:13983 stop:14444 length:462 start_codon:yes stop_codon:yes gene_type:complete